MKEKVLKIIKDALGDAENDLYHADMHFGKRSTEELNRECHGQKGQTCGDTLRKRLIEVDELKHYVLWVIGSLEGGPDASSPPNTLTCVYCGIPYPEGTPPHGSQILTDHIKVCEKHPMRKAEQTIKKLRSALVGLVGASAKDELEQMEVMIRTLPVPEADRMVTLNAIAVLVETEEV